MIINHCVFRPASWPLTSLTPFLTYQIIKVFNFFRPASWPLTNPTPPKKQFSRQASLPHNSSETLPRPPFLPSLSLTATLLFSVFPIEFLSFFPRDVLSLKRKHWQTLSRVSSGLVLGNRSRSGTGCTADIGNRRSSDDIGSRRSRAGCRWPWWRRCRMPLCCWTGNGHRSRNWSSVVQQHLGLVLQQPDLVQAPAFPQASSL